MSIYERLWESDSSDLDIAYELSSVKAMAAELGMNESDIIRMRTALEISLLREAVINTCVFNHRHSYLPSLSRKLQDIAEK